MNLGKGIAGRHRTAGRRKGLAVSSGLMTGHILSRYERSMSGQRPLALVFMRQTAAVTPESVAHNLNIHQQFHLQWQSRLAQFFPMIVGGGALSGQAQIAGRGGSRTARQSFSVGAGFKPAGEEIRYGFSPAGQSVSVGAGFKPALRSFDSKKRAGLKPATSDATDAGGRQVFQHHERVLKERHIVASIRREVLRPLHLHTREIRFVELRSAGSTGKRTVYEGRAMLHPLFQGTWPHIMRRISVSGTVNRTAAQTSVVKQITTPTGGSGDIRLLHALVLKRDGAPSKTHPGPRPAADSRTTEDVSTSLTWTKSRHEAVQMVVRRDESASAPAPDQARPLPTANARQTETARGTESVTVSSTNAAQSRIDVNRLTDDVYRMLERRLITERERRGR